jgi:AraC-like DNA-binding protein
MHNLARNNLLTPLFELAERYGVRRADILDEIGLDEKLAIKPGAFIESTKLIDAVEYAAAKSGRKDFGLLLRALPGGPIGVLIAQCTSVAEAAREGAHYIHLQNTALRYALTAAKDNYVFGLEIASRGKYPPRHYVESLLLACVHFARAQIGSSWCPSAVSFAHESLANPAAYKAAFGVAPAFGQDKNFIVATRKDFDRKIVGSDERTKLVMQSFLAELERQRRNNFVAMVQTFVRPLLSAGKATSADVAALLSLTPRTLQRRLAAEGTTFQRILAETRVEMFNDYAPNGMSLAELAPMLGFSEASAVSRFVKSHTGASARALRKRGKAA